MMQGYPLLVLCWPNTCKCGRVGKMRSSRRSRINWMYANNVGESICDTCGYKTRTHLLRLQSQRLACCKCVCMNVHLCMCQCISVCKTLSCMYVRAFMHLCVCDVSLGVSWGVRLRVCVCVCINVGVLCRFVITEIPLLAPR